MTPAQAADGGRPSWTSPSRLTDELSVVDVTTNGRGDAFAMEERTSGSGGLTRGPDGNWSHRSREESEASIRSSSVAIDSRGNVTMAWSEDGECPRFGDEYSWDEEPFQIRTAYGRAGGGAFRHVPFNWRRNSCTSGETSLAVDRRRTVTLVFRDGIDLYVTQRPQGGRWEKPTLLGTAEGFDVEVAGPRTAVVVWTTSDDELLSSVRTGSARWSDPVTIDVASDPAPDTLSLELVRAPGGGLRALWMQRIAGQTRLRTAGMTRRWGRPQNIVVRGGNRVLQDPHLAISRDGATAVWYERGQDQAGAIRTSSMRNGRWTRPTVLHGRVGRHRGAVSVAANDMGVVAVWGRGSHVFAALQGIGGRWQKPVRLSRARTGIMFTPEVIAYRADMFTAIFMEDGVVAFADFVSDRRAPSARVTGPRPPLTFGRTRFSWDTTDDRTGMASVDVRIRTAGRAGRFSSWSMWLRKFAGDQHGGAFKPGRSHCIAVRARDHQNNPGRWSRPHCVSSAVDDRKLDRSGGWRLTRNERAHQQTLTQTRRFGQRLVLRGVGARQINVVARTCPQCGVVTVTHAGQPLGRIDLSSPRIRDPRVFRLKHRARMLRGPVVVRVVSRGKPVQIDGLIARP